MRDKLRRAIFHKSPYKFDQPVKAEEAPPFPSAPEYDAKAWKVIQENMTRVKLIYSGT